MVLLSVFGVWVSADAIKRKGETQNSILDPSWTIPMEGYAFWTHEWVSNSYLWLASRHIMGTDGEFSSILALETFFSHACR